MIINETTPRRNVRMYNKNMRDSVPEGYAKQTAPVIMQDTIRAEVRDRLFRMFHDTGCAPSSIDSVDIRIMLTTIVPLD